MATLGPVPQRAPVGHGPRGLQRQRRRVELLHPRPGAVAGVQVGRGRDRRPVRRPPAAVLRDRRVERGRPDPQGADVRAHQRRGQPRRGRQGVLLLPRRHADELVPEVPLPLPARRLPVRGPRGDEPGQEPARLRVRADRHRGVRRQPLRRRRRRVRQARPGRHRGADHRRQPQPRRGDDPPAAVAVVPQHVVDGRREGHVARRRRRRECRHRRRAHRPRPARVALCRMPAPLLFTENESNTERLWGTPNAVAVREGRLSRVRRQRPGRGGQPGPHRHQGGCPVRVGDPGRGLPCRPAAPVPGRRRPGRRRRPAVRRTDRRGRPVLRLDHAVIDDCPTRLP